MDDPEDRRYTLSFDLLYKGLEITTGGQRIHDYGQLMRKLESRGMTGEGMEEYLEAFRCGMPPHGGLGIGLERLTVQLIGEDNVREGEMSSKRYEQADTVKKEKIMAGKSVRKSWNK